MHLKVSQKFFDVTAFVLFTLLHADAMKTGVIFPDFRTIFFLKSIITPLIYNKLVFLLIPKT